MADDRDKIARMLLWFEAQLPAHDVSEWFIEAAPQPIPQHIEGEPVRWASQRTGEEFRIQGYGKCVRCDKRFPIMSMGNAVAFDESRIAPVTESMKAWVLRDAERDGPCWGDVPQVPRQSDYSISPACLDHAAS